MYAVGDGCQTATAIKCSLSIGRGEQSADHIQIQIQFNNSLVGVNDDRRRRLVFVNCKLNLNPLPV